MELAYMVGSGLYAVMLVGCLLIILMEKELVDWLQYYKPDSIRGAYGERGGYVDLDGMWVERKVFWRKWGWYGVVAIVFLLSPLLLLYVLVWEGSISRFPVIKALRGKLGGLKELLGRKEAPVIFSGGDGSSRDTAIVIGVDDPSRGIKAEYEYMEQIYGSRNVAWKRDMQVKSRLEGRHYDIISIVLVDGTKKVFWFDITQFVGSW
jgi:hypothetical protein